MKCNDCSNEARIGVEEHRFCEPCFIRYVNKQSTASVEWFGVNSKGEPYRFDNGKIINK